MSHENPFIVNGELVDLKSIAFVSKLNKAAKGKRSFYFVVGKEKIVLCENKLLLEDGIEKERQNLIDAWSPIIKRQNDQYGIGAEVTLSNKLLTKQVIGLSKNIDGLTKNDYVLSERIGKIAKRVIAPSYPQLVIQAIMYLTITCLIGVTCLRVFGVI